MSNEYILTRLTMRSGLYRDSKISLTNVDFLTSKLGKYK